MTNCDPHFGVPIDGGEVKPPGRPLYIATVEDPERLAWRQYAAAAMNGILSNNERMINVDALAGMSVKCADAMVAAENARFASPGGAGEGSE